MTDIVTITGSPSHKSRSAALLNYVGEVCSCQSLTVTPIHVRDFDAEDLLFGRFDSPAIKNKVEEIQQAKAVIIATPVYKAAYTGILKAFLDVLPQNVLRGKIVLPIATGGSLAHLLSLDYALKPVLSVLGAEHILQSIYVVDNQIQYDPEFSLTQDVEQRLLNALHTLTTQVLKAQIAYPLT